MPANDKAIELSLCYLDAIENRLHISWDAENQPVCVLDRIQESSVNGLREDLNDLLLGKPGDDARNATAVFGQQHIQTVGFGLVSRFDQFVKLGFLCGERVVLWDIISSRLLEDRILTSTSRAALAQASCELLMLRPVVEQGGLVILPHPVVWSDLAAQVNEDLRLRENKSTTPLGLSMALAANEEGLPLHPYTQVSDRSSAVDTTNGQLTERTNFSPENAQFQQWMSSLLNEQRLEYLDKISVPEFHEICRRHNQLHRALRKHFSGNVAGLSEQQVRIEQRELTNDLIKLFGKRDAEIRKYATDAGEATVLFALSLLNFYQDQNPLTASLFGTLSTRMFIAVRKWFSAPEKNVIVQAFQEMQQCNGALQKRSVQPERKRPASATNEQTDLEMEKLKCEFMNLDWTEDRHKMLLSLPVNVAQKLLKELRADDLEIIVNHRRFQESYIGDYLCDLWEFDQKAYWKHLNKTFDSPEGILLYDVDEHFRVMSSNDMPRVVWKKMLRSLLRDHRTQMQERRQDYPLSELVEVVRFQTMRSSERDEQRTALLDWFHRLSENDKKFALWFLKWTFRRSLPKWFVEALAD